jgi:hypothetical protein
MFYHELAIMAKSIEEKMESKDNGAHGATPLVLPSAMQVSTATSTAVIAEAVPLTARDIRSMIFSQANKKLRSEVVDFFGTKIEVRQSSMAKVVALNNLEDKMPLILQILLNNVFTPGTDEAVFDVSHIDTLRDMPFGADMDRVTKAHLKLSGVTIDDAVKNLKANPS